MKPLLTVFVTLLLTNCAGFNEMKETGEPPVAWANLYSAAVKTVTRAAIVREPWNYGAGILSAVTNDGIDLRVEE